MSGFLGSRPSRQMSACVALVLVFTSLPMATIAAEGTGIGLPQPLTDADFLHDGRPPEALVDLGRDLFFDPILSGNRNISCGTCHDPSFGTSDGLALGIGEGGDGAGPQRRTAEPVTGRVPRNAPALWNVGARAQRAMFHDGRLEAFEGGRSPFRIPSGAPLPEGLDSLLAAQAFFPVTSSIEMAGQRGENEVANALVSAGFTAAWDVIARRVASVEGYAEKFTESFEEIGTPDQIAYRHVAEALAAFQTSAFRSDTSPFDKALRGGDPGHLSQEAQAGAAIFYGKARCASCHSGPLLTDQDFHAIAVPQIGPGKGHGGADGYWKATGLMAFLEDEGRYRVTGDAADLFAFRTPSLRNVAVTGPWGHSGAFDSLERMVRHHLDAISSLASYRPEETTLPPLDAVMDQLGEDTPTGYSALDHETQAAFENRDGWVQASPSLRGRIAAASTLEPVSLTDAEVGQILSFLETLTDPAAIKRAAQIPDEVPSGLPPQPTPKPAN